MYNCEMNIDRYLHKTAAIDKAGKASLDSLSFSSTMVDGKMRLKPIRHLTISKGNPLNKMTDADHSRSNLHAYFAERGLDILSLAPARSELLGKLYIRQAEMCSNNRFLCSSPRHSSTQSEL